MRKNSYKLDTGGKSFTPEVLKKLTVAQLIRLSSRYGIDIDEQSKEDKEKLIKLIIEKSDCLVL